MPADVRDVVGGGVDVRVPEHDQRAAGRARDELHLRLEDRDAGPLRADQRARDVEPVLGEQVVEVVAGDAPRDVRVALADEVARTDRGGRARRAVDLAAAAARRAAASASAASSVGPTACASAVVGEDLAAARRCRRSRPAIIECTPQVLLPIMPPSVQWSCVAGSGPKVRWYRSAASRSASSTIPGSTRATRRCGSSGANAAEVLREVDHHRDVAALPGEARAAARGRAPARRGAGRPRSSAITSSSERGTTTPMGTWR